MLNASTQQHAGFILPEVRVVLFLPHRELFGTRLIKTVRAFVVVTNCAVTTNFYSGGWVVMKKSQVVKRSIVVDAADDARVI